MTPLKNDKISHKCDSFWKKILDKDFHLFPNIFSQIFFVFNFGWFYIVLAKKNPTKIDNLGRSRPLNSFFFFFFFGGLTTTTIPVSMGLKCEMTRGQWISHVIHVSYAVR